MENDKKGLIVASIVLGLSIVIGTAIVSCVFVSVKNAGDTLSVTGSAKQQITSDSVKWHGGFSRNVSQADIKSGYSQMKQDERAIQKFLKTNGVKDSEINISPVVMNEIYNQDQNAPRQYSLQQTVEVDSMAVQAITSLAKNIQPLIDQGVIFSTQSIEYFTSKLAELRVSLLSDAIKDAKQRAQKIAQSSGKSVGAIQSANMGIVQVTPVNSVDISDYGNYDTSSIEKEVMVTVKALFRLE